MPAAALRIRVPARADQLAPIRAEVGEYACKVGLSAASVEDVRSIVTEACGNSIRHAYGDSPGGFLEVIAHAEDGELCLIIRDEGSGVVPRTGAPLPSLHAGLLIIGALSSSFRLFSRRGGGIELEVRLSLSDAA